MIRNDAQMNNKTAFFCRGPKYYNNRLRRICIFISSPLSITMPSYFIEYEFKSHLGNSYWFPLYINADNLSSAEANAKAIEVAIEEHHTLKRRSQLKLVLKQINAEYLMEYTRNRLKGKIAILEMDIWRFKDVETVSELNFAEHLQLVEYSSLSDDVVATMIAQHKFPVKPFFGNPEIDTNDFLLISVVEPSNDESEI